MLSYYIWEVNALKACKKSREDRLSGIARTFELEIIYAFGSHAEDALNWINSEEHFQRINLCSNNFTM